MYAAIIPPEQNKTKHKRTNTHQGQEVGPLEYICLPTSPSPLNRVLFSILFTCTRWFQRVVYETYDLLSAILYEIDVFTSFF